MEKSKFATVTDEIIRAFAIWLFCVLILRYFIKELYIIIILASTFTMAVTVILRRYHGKKNLESDKIKKCNEAMDELMVMSASRFSERLAESIGGESLEDAVIAQKTLIYPYFCGKLPLDKLNYAYNLALKYKKKLLILCNAISPEVEKNINLFSETPISILNKTKTFVFLEDHDLIPTIKPRPKKKVSLQRIAFSRSKIKGYLLASLILLITAAFSPYSLICIIASAFNIAMSIMCEIKGFD